MSHSRIRQRITPMALALIVATVGRLVSQSSVLLACESPERSITSALTADIDDVEQITGRDVDLINRDLKLNDNQRQLVDALFAGYNQQFETQAAEHRDLIESLYQQARNATDRHAIHVRIRISNDQWAQTRARLNTEFLESVKAILAESQLDRWRLVERDRRRRVMLQGPSRFAAEHIDLINLVEDLNLESEQRSAVDPTLNAWADELDTLLQNRKVVQDQWTKDVEESSDDGNFPEPARQKQWRDRLDQRCRAIRDLNLRDADLVIAHLPPPASNRFRSVFDLAAYPIIYRSTPADRYLESALALPDLSTEQENSITSIERDYDDQVLIINDQLAVIMRRQEDANPDKEELKRTAFEQPGGVTFDGDGNAVIGNLNGVVSMSVTTDPRPDGDDRPRVIVPGLDRADPASPQGQLEKSKRDLIQRTIDAAWAVLNPAQQDAAPRPTAQEMLTPEEKMRRVMEKAFSTAKVTRRPDGSVTFELHIDENDGSMEK